ncbi:uncharacterized protein LOC135713387 [Ochlerotatus camptorhynchus]|uniref:uncharacterized protein LOC135713387 n=1 Tax=Ochlerotatus camptorhynchus TaxID=644619 RepID=UPI0031DFFE07
MIQPKTNSAGLKTQHWSQVNILMLINPLHRLLTFHQNVIHAGHNSPMGRLHTDLIKRLSVLQQESVAFKDFVSFLFNETNDALLSEYREFYYPISTMCQPCQIDYQYIVNFEDPGTVSSLQRLFDNRGLTLHSRNGTLFAQGRRQSKMMRKSRLYELNPLDIRKVIEFYESDRKLLGVGLW